MVGRVGICCRFDREGDFVPQQSGKHGGSLPVPERRLPIGEHLIKPSTFLPAPPLGMATQSFQ